MISKLVFYFNYQQCVLTFLSIAYEEYKKALTKNQSELTFQVLLVAKKILLNNYHTTSHSDQACF